MTKFRAEQIAPQWPLTWALTEWLYWSQEVNDILTGIARHTRRNGPADNRFHPETVTEEMGPAG